MRRQIPHLHVLSHPLSKNRHGKLLCDMKALQAAPPASRNRTSPGMQEDQMVAPKLATSRHREAVMRRRGADCLVLARKRGNAREVIAIGSGQPATGGRRIVRRIAKYCSG